MLEVSELARKCRFGRSRANRTQNKKTLNQWASVFLFQRHTGQLFRLLHDALEGGGVIEGEVGQHFAVQLDAGLFKPPISCE